MGLVKVLTILVKNPLDLKTLVQFYLWYHQKRRNSAWKRHLSSGWDRQTMKRCWELFATTDKGFCALTKLLDGDIAGTIALLYIVLRALDTIEDDMTLPDDVKQALLRSFHIHTVTPGWKFDGCGPNEKHRQLLVEYDNVVEEINLLPPQYKNIIIDSALRTGTGMADHAHKVATTGSIYIETIAEYEQYCHYTCGITVQAVSQIFSISGKESPSIGAQLELSNSMGLLFQKRDTIGDYREDVDQQRYFWPREIWGREQYGFKEMSEMSNTDPDTVRRALYAQSEMILDALKHVTDGIDYLLLLKNQSLIHTSAILGVTVLADLELYFMNKEVFQRKVKVRKAEVAKLIMRCTKVREVALIGREYARKIRAKADRSDPNFTGIVIACGKIEERCEPYCVEKSSTAKFRMTQLMMYAAVALILALVLSLSRIEID